MVEGVSCSNEICTEERDIWIFSRESGNMVSRSTCVICVDGDDACQDYDDVCFNADFNGNHDMTSCALILQDTDPTVSCSDCRPCVDEENGDSANEWGMEFNCFEGRWDSQGACIRASRIGHYPTFPASGDVGYVDKVGSDRNDTGDDDADGNFFSNIDLSDTTTILIIVGAIVLGLMIGVLVSIYAQPVLPMEEGAGGNIEKGEAVKSANKDPIKIMEPSSRPTRQSSHDMPNQISREIDSPISEEDPESQTIISSSDDNKEEYGEENSLSDRYADDTTVGEDEGTEQGNDKDEDSYHATLQGETDAENQLPQHKPVDTNRRRPAVDP
jgi:hypothetical protein